MNKSKPISIKRLYRYTSIPVLLDMLLNKRLFLSNPKSWTDKTDAAFLEKHANGKEIRVLCFFKNGESNQYWELYAKYGCMIEFEAEKLLGDIPKSGFKHRDVDYVKQNEFNLKECNEILPFVKQLRYKGEREYRIVWIGEEEGENSVFIPINLNSINKIFISGDVKEEIADSLRHLIREIIGRKIKVIHSKLYENNVWIGKINPKPRKKP